jgi:iron(III) transport system permease protein
MTTLTDTRRLGRGWDPAVLIQWAIVVGTAAIVLAPILPILYQASIDRALYEADAGFTLGNFARLGADSGFWQACLNSIVFTIGATIVAQALGLGVALLAGRTNVWGKALLTLLVIWPLLVSDLVKSVGFSIMYGPAGWVTSYAGLIGLPTWNINSMWGMIVIGGVSQAPITYLYCIAAVRAMDASLEDAARTSGASALRTLFLISVPLMLPAFLASAFVSLIANLESLSIPLIFGRPSGITFIPTYLYYKGVQGTTSDYGLVAAAAVFVLILALLMVLVQRRLLGDIRRFVTIGGKASRQKPIDLGAARLPLSILMVFLLLALVAVPLLGVVLYAFSEFFSPLIPITKVLTLKNFEAVFTEPMIRRGVVNSLIIATFGAAVATFLVFMISTVVNRTRHPGGPVLDFAAIVPRAVAGIIAGLGFFYASVIFPPLAWTRGTIVLLMIAFIMRHLPLGYGAITPNLIQVSRDIESSARTSGASWFRGVTSILMPIVAPGLIATYAVFFLQFLKEYSAAVFLTSPGTEIIGTVMLSLVWESQMGKVAALAMVQVVIALIFLAAIQRFAKVKLYD